MIKNFVPSEWKEEEYYELCFDDGHGNGLCFPCDRDGNLFDSATDAARKNHLYAMQHPEKFERWNKVVKRKRTYKENAKGTCNCGEEIELYNEYMGACECPKCGQWWNLFGQELNPVETWASGEDW